MLQDNGQKKYIQIADHIRANIEAGVYREGTKIPPIRVLAREYAVNPQTVNKATAYLTSLGYLRSRQGSGSEVFIPEKPGRGGVSMLIDTSRSGYLEDLDNPRNYHAKDIYLHYLMRMTRDGRQPRFLVYSTEDNEPTEEIRAAAGEASGFIVQGCLPDAYASLLAGADVPTVLVNRPVPETHSGGRIASIMIGLEQLASMVDYLVTLGHRNILYLRSMEFERSVVYEERLRTVREAASRWRNEHTITIEEFEFDPQDDESLSRFRDLIASGFSSAVGYNDGSALAVYSLLQRSGRSVGNEFAVGGFDDTSAAQLALPPLTTVRVDRSKLVREAFDLLYTLSTMSGPVRLTRTLETELMIRRSALPPRHTVRNT